MLKSGDKVLAGVSGGADSVCLLFLLRELQEKMREQQSGDSRKDPFSIEVVHINHKIRREAAEDADFVRTLCESMDIPFHLVENDVKKSADMWKCSEEEAGRRVRYEAFSKIGGQVGANRIAVAHNSNDLAETMLFHLFRGSGMKGLAGIAPCRGEIIRPLLCLERREIEAYLQERELTFRQDATNETDDYTRNRIRHHILPFAEQEIAAGCVAHMAQTAGLLQETEEYLALQTEDALKKCVTVHMVREDETVGEMQDYELAEKRKDCEFSEEVQGYELCTAGLLAQHPTIQKRMLFSLLMNLSPHGKDITSTHVKDLLELFTREGNREICLPFGIRGRREYEKVFLEKQNAQKTADIPLNEYTKCFDCDKIEKPLELRTRQTGDYLTIAGGDGTIKHQSLKDYFINQKIPAKERDLIPLLAEGSHILWVVGHRISEYYKVTGNTKSILQVQLTKKHQDNEESQDSEMCQNHL